MNYQLLKRLSKWSRQHFLPTRIRGKQAQDLIYSLLDGKEPCMIARFGSVEIQGCINGTLPPPLTFFKQRTYTALHDNSGFFPVTPQTVKRFAKLMTESMKQLDCLGSWRIEELYFYRKLKHCRKVGLDEIGPFSSERNIWYRVLEGKKVLVIHPFTELIEYQYKHNRKNIWKKPDILPEYKSLTIIKAVQSIGGNQDFKDWFEALDYMKKEIDKADFEIALIGCGAYGFPLAAYVKSIGKKAVHIGGALQLVYGIKGKRWENADFINEYWISPRPEDRPKGWNNVEGGCYW